MLEHLGRVHALKPAVVHRQDARQALQVRLIAVDTAQEDRDERGVPIVRVHDQRAFAEAPRDLDRCGSEQGEALRVVRIVAARIAVKPRAVERRVVLEKHRLRIVVTDLVPDAHLLAPPTADDGEWLGERFDSPGVGSGLAIQRQDDVALRPARRLMIGDIGDRLA